MVLTEHADGNLDIAQFVTLSQPDLDERAMVAGLFQLLQTWPDAELVTWAGMVHDIPLIMMAAYSHGLTLPRGWRWLSFGGNDPARHLDFASIVTGGFKIKPIHLRSEEHTSELQSLMRISYAVFCLKKKRTTSQRTYSIK